MNKHILRLFPAAIKPLLLLSVLLLPLSPVFAESADDLYEDALGYFEDGDLTSATIQLKNALQENPQHLPARVLLGRTQIKQGEAASAEKELNRARTQGADNDLVLIPLGNAYYAQRKYQKILSDLHPSGSSTWFDSEILTLRGKSYLELGDLKEAENAFSRASALEPDSVGPLFGQAMIYIRKQYLDEARTILEKAVKLDPENAEVWYLRGDLARLNHDTNAALAAYSKAIEAQPGHNDALKARAGMLMILGRDEEALKDIKIVQKRDKIDPQANYLYAMLLARAGKQEESDLQINKLANIMSGLEEGFIESHGPTLLLSGVIEYIQKHTEKAIARLKRYIDRYPAHAGARIMLADIALAEGRYDEVIELLSPLRQNSTTDSKVYEFLGKAYLAKKEYNLANELLEKASGMKPGRADLLTSMAISKLSAGRPLEATEDFAAAVAADKTDEKAAILLGFMQIQQRNFEEAEKTATKLIEVNPKNAIAHNMLGSAKLGLGDIDAARVAYEKALSVKPDFEPARLNLANLDIRNNRMKTAISTYRDILKTAPNNLHAMNGLVRVAEATGDLKEAIKWLERMLSINPDSPIEQLRLSELYIKQKMADKALTILKALDKKIPSNLNIQETMIRAYLAAKDRESAKKIARVMYDNIRNSASWLQKIAMLQIRAGDFINAQAYIDAARLLDKDNLAIMTAQINLNIATKDYPQAEKLSLEMINKYPDISGGELLLGDTYMHMSLYNKALKAYNAGFKKQPTRIFVLSRYQAARTAGFKKEAVEMLSSWLDSHPEDTQVRQVYASVLMKMQENDKAIIQFEHLLKSDPKSSSTLNNLAMLYIKKSPAKAELYAQQSYKNSPRNIAVNDTLGWVMVNVGDVQKGLTFLREAQARAPEVPDIQYHIAFALNKLGRNREAKELLTKLLKTGKPFDARNDANALLKKL